MPAFSFDSLVDAFLALLSIINPVTVVPLYAQLAEGLDKPQRHRLFATSVGTAFITLAVLMATGRWVMQYVFQIQVAEFRLAGGILLTVIAVKNIVFFRPEEFTTKADKVMEMGIVPMAIPLLVGPGALVTGILVLDRDGWLVAGLAVLANFILSWVVVHNSVFLARLMGHTGTLVISKILWIFIAAIGAHFLLSGISEVFGIPLHLGNSL